MAQRPYMPPEDEGIAVMLTAFDENIPPLQIKYGLTSGDVLRIHQARLAWRWFLDCLDVARQWSESATSKKNEMRHGPFAGAQAMPAGPICPPVPLIDLGLGPVPIKWEPDFFDYFGKIVARIKNTVGYEKADGDLLGIEGAEIPPPEPSVSPNLKVTIGTGGVPELDAVRGVFDGYDFQFKIGDGAVQQGPFVNKRHFLHVITLPPPGQAVVVSYCAQFRYKGVPFGQHSAWVVISVHG
jgi:hypothetical protein